MDTRQSRSLDASSFPEEPRGQRSTLHKQWREGSSSLIRCLVWLAFLVIPPFLGEVYGTLKKNGQFVADAKLTLACGASGTASTTTDRLGSFRLFVQGQGPCALEVVIQQDTFSVQVTSFPGPVAYDLVLQPNPDGSYRLLVQ